MYGRSNDSTLLGRIEQDISAAFPEKPSFSPTYAYTFTWKNVPPYIRIDEDGISERLVSH